MINDKHVVKRILEMGTESLNPDSFDDLERIAEELRTVRKSLSDRPTANTVVKIDPSKIIFIISYPPLFTIRTRVAAWLILLGCRIGGYTATKDQK